MDAHVRCRQDSSHVRYCYLDIDQLSYKRRASPYGSVINAARCRRSTGPRLPCLFCALPFLCGVYHFSHTFRNAEDMTIIYHIDT